LPTGRSSGSGGQPHAQKRASGLCFSRTDFQDAGSARGRGTGTWRSGSESNLVWTAGGRKSLPSSVVNGIRRTGEDIEEAYKFSIENHEKLSHSDATSVGTVSKGNREKELTR